MKLTVIVAVFAVLALTSAACGPSREEQQAAEIQKSAQEMQKGAENMAKGAEDMARSMSDLASGLSAAFGGDPNAKPADPVSFRDLQTVLPELSGWERGKPTGERMTAPVNFSEASVDAYEGRRHDHDQDHRLGAQPDARRPVCDVPGRQLRARNRQRLREVDQGRSDTWASKNGTPRTRMGS